jgi:hypothetical protein
MVLDSTVNSSGDSTRYISLTNWYSVNHDEESTTSCGLILNSSLFTEEVADTDWSGRRMVIHSRA